MPTSLAPLDRLLIESDPWQALDLPHNADALAVKKAYRALSRIVHPDKNPGCERATRAFQWERAWDAATRAWGPGFNRDRSREIWREAMREAERSAAAKCADEYCRKAVRQAVTERAAAERAGKRAAAAEREEASEEDEAWGPSHPGFREAQREWRQTGGCYGWPPSAPAPTRKRQKVGGFMGDLFGF